MKCVPKFLIAIIFSFYISQFSFALDDTVFLQSTPIFVGEENFDQRIQQIKEEREPLGLVLSGGSARAYAHIGVLRQLEKADIKPDFIVANSMGAIIGLLYSAGFSADNIQQIVTSVELTSFFDIVFPLKGGILSSRYFAEALSRLFPDSSFDIANSFIPIIVPAEDFYTKRQILFAQGDIVEVMRAAFAMSFMMEPVEYYLPDGTKTLLIDSGAIDLGSFSIAKRISDNLIVSTALYTPILKGNNPITILNRTLSIGKERVLIQDILNYSPLLIRNDVENYSFMDFANVTEIINKGDICTKDFLLQSYSFYHGNYSQDTDTFSVSDFKIMRAEKKEITETFCSESKAGRKPYSKTPYAGIKIRPNVNVIDTPDFLLAEPFSIGIYGFFDYKSLYTRMGINTDFGSNYGIDAFVKLQNYKGANLIAKTSYTSTYKNKNVTTLFIGSSLSIPFFVLNSLFIRPNVEIEYLNHNTSKNDILFHREGIRFENLQSSKCLLSFNPYIFFHKNDFTNLSEITEIPLGLGLKSMTSVYPFHWLGLSLTETTRYSKNNSVNLLNGDNWKGASKNTFFDSFEYHLLSLTECELFWFSANTTITAMETLKLEKIKMGLYGAYLFGFDDKTDKSKNNTLLGLFTRLQISMAGLTKITFEVFTGWDIAEQSVSGKLSFAQYW